MARSFWIGGLMCGALAAATGSSGRSALAQEDVLVPGGAVELKVQRLDVEARPRFDVLVALADDAKTEDEASGEYWLGIEIAALPELAKQQLGVEHGLVVEDVAPDSPAAKAEIKKHDILIKAGDTQLKEAADLIKSVNASEGKEITITVIRGGKDRTLKVVATRRPQGERFALRSPQPELRAEIKKLEEALENLKNKAGKEGLGLLFARPAIVAPRVDVKLPPLPKDFKGEFPKDLSVQITKQGDQPTKIHVKRGDKEWDVTEEKLEDLPDDIRPHVQSLLGRMLAPGFAAAGRRTVRVSPEGKVEGELKIEPVPPQPPAAPGYPAIPSAPYRRGVLPAPQAAPAVPLPPRARAVPNWGERGDPAADSRLDAIMKKLDQIDKEMKQLRKENEELRSKSPSR